MALDKIIIENFRAFKGQHIFDLKQLNIFTGANSSGKSTLIKAVSLFAKGLAKGDFPFIDLFESNSGSFNELVNRDSLAESFKIGFFVEAGENHIPLKVLYEFVDGSGTEKSENSAVFNKLEIINMDDEVLLFVQNAETFNDKDSVNFHDEGYPINSPMTYENPALAFLAINVDVANKFCSEKCKTDFSYLFNHLNHVKQNDGFWWSEIFEEEEYDFLGLSELSFEDLIIELFRDPFFNLAKFEDKENLLYKDGDPVDYNNLKDSVNYEAFLARVINEIFQGIEIELEKYRSSSFEYVTQQNIGDILLMQNKKFGFLNYLVRRRNETHSFNEFMREALSLFGIDGYLELQTINNTMLEFYLVSGLEEVDKEWLTEEKEEHEPLQGKIDYRVRYQNNARRNINELGKGLQSLIFTMARIFVVINKFRVVRWKNVELVKAKGKAAVKFNPNLILIEEPEAFLHPNWQSRLADFFVFCNEYSHKHHQKAKVNMVIETHSIFFVQRLQILVAEKKIQKDNLQILYFKDVNHTEKYYEMRLRDDGVFLDNFGQGFDDEIHKNALKLASLGRKN